MVRSGWEGDRGVVGVVQMTDPARVEIDVEVRYAETDQMGVVHHANYLIWFEQARTRLCQAAGTHYAEIEGLGYLLIVTRAEVRYLQPARYGDTVQVGCWIEDLGSRGLRFGYEVRRDGQRLATGATEHIWLQVEDRRPCRMPDALREPFERLAGR